MDNEELASRVPFGRDANTRVQARVKLVVGSEIELVSKLPKYRVTEIDDSGAEPRIKMVTDGPLTGALKGHDGDNRYSIPAEIELRGNKTFMIGRGEKCDARIHFSGVSRTHVSLHYDQRERSFIMSGLNRNLGYADNVFVPSRERQQDLVGAAQTIVAGDLRDEKKEMTLTEVLLRPGQLIKFHRDEAGFAPLPSYEVKRAVGGVKPELVLEVKGDSHGFPRRIEATGKNGSVDITRGGQGVNFNHPLISRLHGSIAWDEPSKSWSYMTLQEPPEVHMGSKFLQEMQEAAEGVRPASAAEAREQIQQIDAIIGGMQEVRGKMRNVEDLMRGAQNLEVRTILTPEYERGRGAHTEDSQAGYKNWIDAYRLLRREQLNPEERKLLATASDAVGQIGAHRDELRKIEDYAESLGQRREMAKFQQRRGHASDEQKEELLIFDKLMDSEKAASVPPRDVLKLVERSNFNNDLDTLVRMETGRLEKNPPEDAFPSSGYLGHHTVMRIQKDAAGYVVTSYNTGGRAKPSPRDGGMVMGMYRQRLKPDADIKAFVKLVNLRKMLGDEPLGNGVEKVMEGMLGPVTLQRDEPPQGKGNCTTRSTREMLKDVLPGETFAHLHQHVSNPQVCDPAEAMAALQMRRDALNQYLEHADGKSVVRPQGQRDWSESISELKLGDSQLVAMKKSIKPDALRGANARAGSDGAPGKL